MNFGPSLRDDHRRIIFLNSCNVRVGQSLLLIAFGTGDNGVHLFQSPERLTDFAGLCLTDRLPVLLDAFAFFFRFRQCRVLAANRRKLDNRDLPILFDDSEGIACFDRAVLLGITGKNDAAFICLDELQKLQHLPDANLSGFIHQHHRARRQRFSQQERTDRFGLMETVLFQPQHLLARAMTKPLRFASRSPATTSRSVWLLPVPAPPRNNVT